MQFNSNALFLDNLRCDKKNKKPAADTREAKNTQDVVLQSLEMEKFSDSIQQNFTLYPGQGVILPQEFAGGDADSTMVSVNKVVRVGFFLRMKA